MNISINNIKINFLFSYKYYIYIIIKIICNILNSIIKIKYIRINI